MRNMINNRERRENIENFLVVSKEKLQEKRIEKYCDNAIVNTVLVIKKRCGKEKTDQNECKRQFF